MKNKIEWKQMGQVLATVVKLFTNITAVFKKIAVGPEILEWLVEDGKEFFESKLTELGQEFLKTINAKNPDRVKMIGWWEAFYKKHFGINVSLSGIQIPDRPAVGKWRLLILVPGLTNNCVYDVLQKHFTCWRYTEDLDAGVPVNERDPSKIGAYAIWVRDVIEADDCHKNKSANMVAAERPVLKTETLLERMIHELVYFLETDGHLDTSNWTLCSGSRGAGGDVPCACWYGGKFQIDWFYAGYWNDGLRPREVISLV